MAKVTKAIENFIFWWSPSKFLTQLKNFLKTPETLTEMLSNWKRRIVTLPLLSSDFCGLLITFAISIDILIVFLKDFFEKS